MPKFQATIEFEMTREFIEQIPAHRTYINALINKNVLDQYAVSLEAQQAWITLTARSKQEAERILSKSPLSPFWTMLIDELFVLDGQHFRLPGVNPN